jgi:acetyl-CoA carboxylase biotin carboxylase subunit
MFSKVLVANRGEIAVRVIRSLAEMGVRSVAVHSEADAGALHARIADEAVAIGGSTPKESYLNQARILEAAEETGAEAIHPGYGFLSENAAFAEACAKKKIVFIGPTPKAMTLLGEKVAARALAIKTGVPVAQGSPGALKDAKEAAEIARSVGYPVMLKAAAGGGGMGMRIVHKASEMESLFESARDQSEKAFGNGALFLEKYLDHPRHVEVQILADADGQVVHLFERDCSVQRRHQKLVEEAPSPALDAQSRDALTKAAVSLAAAGGYRNAGTMEFLLQDGKFYFNEMNTRLQVEHPVTEMVTGIDLVQAQLRIAAKEPLGFAQKDVTLRGHAIECRINAEDPLRGFLPTPGPVRTWRPPEGPWVRVDSGLREGWSVPTFYDNLVAKVITWAPERRAAIQRMRHALDDMTLEGFVTNRALHQAILEDPGFVEGQVTTRFLETSGVMTALETKAVERRTEAAALAAVLAFSPQGGLGSLAVRSRTPARRMGK